MEHTEIDVLLDQAFDLRGKDIHGSVQLANLALARSNEAQYPHGKAKAESHLGLFHLVQGEFELARQFTESALDYFTVNNNLKGIADANYNLASIHYRSNDYYKGLQLMLECLKTYRKIKDLPSQARALIPIGTIYEYFGDYHHAAKVYHQCVEISKEISDLNLESNAYIPLCGIYLKHNQIDQAFDLIEKSIAIKKQTGDSRGLAFAIYTRGKGYLRKREFGKALDDLDRALSITTGASDRLGQGMVLNKMGTAYFEMGNWVEARKCFLAAEDVALQYNITFVLSRAHHNLYELCKAENKAAEALAYLEKSIKLRDGVFNKETFNILSSYDALLKIEMLEHETRLQREKNNIVEQKNAELDSFFYRISHDLKGPVSSLLGLNNLVQMEIKDLASLKLFDLYHGQVNRINNIVMGLINLTSIKNTKELKAKIDFDKLVEECIHSCHYLDLSSKVMITRRIERIEYYSEWAIVNTILQNLIENAIKYSRQEIEPFVDIRISVDQDYITIRVEDNGQGIPEEHLGLIFEMFYRANNKVKGSGLGLYILKCAVERLQGSIQVKSTLHVGSVFTVKLPLGGNFDGPAQPIL